MSDSEHVVGGFLHVLDLGELQLVVSLLVGSDGGRRLVHHDPATRVESLQEKPMVPAARIEKALRAHSVDRLSAVPDHLRPTMETMIEGEKQVLPAEVVHLPAPHLQKPEEYLMAVQANGVAETPVTPSELSRQALERWAQRQSPTARGTVRPVMVVLQPLAAESRANER